MRSHIFCGDSSLTSGQSGRTTTSPPRIHSEEEHIVSMPAPVSTAPAPASPGVAAPTRPTAAVYCEANFGEIDGKTANGLVRHSERYEIVAVIDSRHSGLDAGQVLGDKPNGIPVVADLAGATTEAGGPPDFLIYGMAPTSGMLSPVERGIMLDAMSRGMSIVNGL